MRKMRNRFNVTNVAGNQVTFGNPTVAGAAIFKKATLNANPANAAVNPADDNDGAGANNTHTS